MESGGRSGGMLSVTWISLSLLGELIGQFHKDGNLAIKDHLVHPSKLGATSSYILYHMH